MVPRVLHVHRIRPQLPPNRLGRRPAHAIGQAHPCRPREHAPFHFGRIDPDPSPCLERLVVLLARSRFGTTLISAGFLKNLTPLYLSVDMQSPVCELDAMKELRIILTLMWASTALSNDKHSS